jgi:hypothetical protein
MLYGHDVVPRVFAAWFDGEIGTLSSLYDRLFAVLMSCAGIGHPAAGT